MAARELLVLRHAKSDREAGAADFDRPLAKRGRRDAPRVGRLLRERGLVPDFVVSSPARRAAETVALVLKALAIDKDGVRWEEDLYEADVGTLLRVASAVPDRVGRLLLVGHNPGLEDLVRRLAPGAEAPPGQKLLPTGALARLSLARPWAEIGEGPEALVEILRPREFAE